MQIIYKKLDELKVYENNPRRNDDAVDTVAKSIQEFGFKVPLIIDKNNVIVCGHTRFKACLQLAMADVPCIVADDLTEEQIKAFRLVDNKTSELSAWDFDKLEEELSGIAFIDMQAFEFEEIQAFEDKTVTEYDENSAFGEKEEDKMVICPSCGMHFIPAK